MIKQADILALAKLSGETDHTLLAILLQDAESFVLSYTGRKYMIPALNKPVRDLALIALNRMGTEGEKSRTEGDESYTFDDVPDHIYKMLNQYRLCRVGGAYYENKKK